MAVGHCAHRPRGQSSPPGTLCSPPHTFLHLAPCTPLPQSLSTFGFRGEALSSMCALADVSVVTRTVQQDAGVRLEYDHQVSALGVRGRGRRGETDRKSVV